LRGKSETPGGSFFRSDSGSDDGNRSAMVQAPSYDRAGGCARRVIPDPGRWTKVDVRACPHEDRAKARLITILTLLHLAVACSKPEQSAPAPATTAAAAAPLSPTAPPRSPSPDDPLSKETEATLRTAVGAIREHLQHGRRKRHEATRECMMDFRDRQAAISATMKPIDALPVWTPGRQDLQAAAGFARGCVACTAEQAEQCAEGEKDLREAEKELAEAKK
jgi:hypothetical protein